MLRRALLTAFSGVAVWHTGVSHAADADGKLRASLRDTVWAEAADHAGLADPLVVYAVALFESGTTDALGHTAPYPWTLGFAGVDVRAKSQVEAAQALSAVTSATNVDIGLMQVNYSTHHARVSAASDMLDPTCNVRLGGQILREALRSAPGDLVLGLGRYHSWSGARARWYGTAVWRLYLALASAPSRVGG